MLQIKTATPADLLSPCVTGRVNVMMGVCLTQQEQVATTQLLLRAGAGLVSGEHSAPPGPGAPPVLLFALSLLCKSGSRIIRPSLFGKSAGAEV